MTLAEYEEDWDYPVVFPPKRPALTIGEVISREGRGQLHVAETEKYPHVTYFFNGGEETPYEGEVRELVPSPRDVPTYDHKPEMSAREATDAFVEHFEAEEPAFSIINFANPDMVGHTGVIEAAVKAVETVDECLGRVVEAVHAAGGACIVTADHGNCDHMLNDDGSTNTAHSLNPVPFIVTAGAEALDGEGILADVAPTALELLGIEQPEEMTGRSLIAVRLPTQLPRARLWAMATLRTPRNLTPVELGAWRGMLRVHTALVKALDAELAAAHDLPLSSYEVLITLESAPGPQAPDGRAGRLRAAVALGHDAARGPAGARRAARARPLHR